MTGNVPIHLLYDVLAPRNTSLLADPVSRPRPHEGGGSCLRIGVDREKLELLEVILFSR